MTKLPFSPELKFLLVSALAVPTCFMAGYAVLGVPGARKVL